MNYSNENIKKAFSKIKEEINDLHEEMFKLRQEINSSNRVLVNIFEQILGQKKQNFTQDVPEKTVKAPKNNSGTQAGTSGTPFLPKESIIEKKIELGLKKDSSIGNQGVQALRRYSGVTQAHLKNAKINEIPLKQDVDTLKGALDQVFKKLTKQEFRMFSLIYQMEEEFGRAVSYSDIALRSNLSRNAIRDYISKLIAKNVPISKEKANNREVFIKIKPELKAVHTLDNLVKIFEV